MCVCYIYILYIHNSSGIVHVPQYDNHWFNYIKTRIKLFKNSRSNDLKSVRCTN